VLFLCSLALKDVKDVYALCTVHICPMMQKVEDEIMSVEYAVLGRLA